MTGKILTCALLLLGLTISTLHAEYEDYSPFEGFYFGGNLGVGTEINRRANLDSFFISNNGWKTCNTNFVGGAQFGYDHVCRGGVGGIIFDWKGTFLEEKITFDPGQAMVDKSVRSRIDWITTIRGKGGIAFERVQFYTTVGAALARIKTEGKDDPYIFETRDRQWGITGGFGTQFNYCRNLHLGVEALFYHFERKNRSYTDTNETKFGYSHDNSIWTVCMTINYRFDDR